VNSIEDRLRDAARAAAGTVPDGSAPPLRLPGRRLRLRSGLGSGLLRPRGRLLAVIAPAAAAAAVAGVLAVAVVAHGHDRAAGPAAGPVAAPRVPPPYLVALRYLGQYKSRKLHRLDAVIASTATGRALATIGVPHGYNSFVAVTGAYDDRTFVLAAQQLSRGRGLGALFPATRLYRLHFRVIRGELASYSLSPLAGVPLPAATFGQMALSPDGTRLAVTRLWTQPGTKLVGLRVYNLVTGQVRSWPLVTPVSEGTGGYPIDIIETPSWAADGRHLALTVSSGKCQSCVRLLDTRGPGTTVQAASRVIVRTPDIHSPNVDWATTLLAPDGTRVLRSVTICGRTSPDECYDTAHVYAYSARSGQRLVALREPARNIEVDLMWSSPGGTSFVFSAVAEGSGPPFIRAFRYARGAILTGIGLPAQTVTATW
jgi:hypothetical protein